MRKIMLRAAAVGTAMMLTAAGCKQSNDTIYVPVSVDKEKPVPVFTGITDLQTYLEGQQLVPLKLSVDLSGDNLPALFAALAAAGKYVSLDPSGCTGLDAWGAYTDAGAGRIVSLVLPDSVAEIAEGNVNAGTFDSFTSLETLTANGVKTVGSNAFRRCAALTSISMPAATAIGGFAFSGCSALASINVPSAATIGAYAFGSPALTPISLPAATAIGASAFQNCAALETANLPAAATIGENAFQTCAVLETANLPAAATIGANAFQGCPALKTVNLPAATAIGDYAFQGCAALASLTLGATPPELGTTVFYNAGNGAGFTIYVPEAAKTAFDAAIADTGSDWYKALYTNIGAGKYGDKVEITQQ